MTRFHEIVAGAARRGVLLLLALAPTVCTADSALDLRTALRLARDAELQSALDAASLAAVEADRRSASAHPNPVISYGRLRPGRASTMFDGSRQQDVAIEQPLLLGGQRRARMDAAERAVDAARARVAVSRMTRAADAALAFVSLQAAQSRQAAATAALNRLEDIVASASMNPAAHPYAEQRLAFERADWRAALSAADAELAAARQRLADMLDIADWRTLVVVPLNPLDLVAANGERSDHLALHAARLEETAAEAAGRAARAERFPQVSLGLIRSWTSEPYGIADGVSVSVELPLFDRRDGAVDRADALAAGARLQRQLLEAEIDLDARRNQIEVAMRRDALAAFDAEVGPRLQALLRLAGDAYRNDSAGPADLIDALRAQQRATLRRIELEEGLLRAEIRLLLARSELPGLLD